MVADGTTNSTATDLTLVGRAVTNFGEFQNENYVFLLENFADSVAPSQPILGQLWYNSSTDEISAYSTADVFVALASQDYVQAQKISPAFTGIPTAPTATVAVNSTQLATTAFVQNNKVSPAFSGTPTAPTATYNNNTTQIATTAFVQGEKLSPALTGSPTAPTAAYNTNTTQIATTAFVANSPQFIGTPTAPTAIPGTATTQIATTEFVLENALTPDATTTTKGKIKLAGDLSGTADLPSVASGAIDNSKISPTAAIADTKLATISSLGKVSNSATTATNTNTINTIV